MRSVRASAIETNLPETVSDAALAETLGVDVAAVEAVSGGRARTEAPDGVGPADLCKPAAEAALAASGAGVDDVDFFIFSTATPDIFFPGSACVMQAKLDAPTVGCVDVRSQCTGFVVALDLASRFVATGEFDRVVVAAGEVPSHHNRRDGEQLALAAGMSDAGAVAVVEAGEGSGAILATHAQTDGSGATDYWCEFPASSNYEPGPLGTRSRLTQASMDEGRHFPTVDLDALRATAEQRIPEVLERLLADAGLDGVAASIVAHLDPATEKSVGGALGGKAGAIHVPGSAYAMSASLPVAFETARRAGTLKAGEPVALLTAGSGASWGGAILVA